MRAIEMRMKKEERPLNRFQLHDSSIVPKEAAEEERAPTKQKYSVLFLLVVALEKVALAFGVHTFGVRFVGGRFGVVALSFLDGTPDGSHQFAARPRTKSSTPSIGTRC